MNEVIGYYLLNRSICHYLPNQRTYENMCYEVLLATETKLNDKPPSYQGLNWATYTTVNVLAKKNKTSLFILLVTIINGTLLEYM